MTHRLIILSSLFAVTISLSLWAADKHSEHTHGKHHGDMNHNAAVPLQQGGQAMFAAIIEIVSNLERDPDTDWEAVNIDQLRAHLVDMHLLMLDTEATTSVTGSDQIQFDIQGTATSISSIHRMAAAHSRFIEHSRGWKIQPTLTDEGATIIITVDNKSDLEKLAALGFYGFMSLDSHHQAHHYQMATGGAH